MKTTRVRPMIVLLAALAVLLAAAPAGAARRRSGPPPLSGPPGTLGVVTTTTNAAPSCPAGFGCQVVTVQCPTVTETRAATIATAAATGTPRGVVAFFTGGHGSSFWSSGGTDAAALMGRLRAAGLTVVQVRWHQSWLASAPGESIGSAYLACRPATVAKWVHDTRFAPLASPATTVGTCGFCLVGASGGASGISYALSHYGLDPYVDGLFPTGGPPHAALAKGCMRTPGEEDYWYDGASVKAIDSSYGYTKGGPCLVNDPAFESRWVADSIDITGTDFAYPTTRVRPLLGSLDPLIAHTRDYTAALAAAGTDAPIETVPGAGHDLARHSAAVDRIYELLTASA